MKTQLFSFIVFVLSFSAPVFGQEGVEVLSHDEDTVVDTVLVQVDPGQQDCDDVVSNVVLEIDSDDYSEPSVPDKLPTTIAEIKAYAMSEIREGWVHLSYSSGIGESGWNDDWKSFTGTDVSDVLKQVNDYNPKFQTYDPKNERVTVWADLNDSQGYALFSGKDERTVTVDKANGASVNTSVKFDLVNWFPLKVGDATSLRIRANLGQYHIVVFDDRAYDGRVWVPINLFGRGYEYTLTDKFGNKHVYVNGVYQTMTTVEVNDDGFRIRDFTDLKLNSYSVYDEYVVEAEMVEKPTPHVFRLNTASNQNVFNLDYSLRRADGSVVRPGKAKWFMVGLESKTVEVPVSPDGKFRVRLPYSGEYFMWLVLDDLENPPYEDTPGKG